MLIAIAILGYLSPEQMGGHCCSPAAAQEITVHLFVDALNSEHFLGLRLTNEY